MLKQFMWVAFAVACALPDTRLRFCWRAREARKSCLFWGAQRVASSCLLTWLQHTSSRPNQVGGGLLIVCILQLMMYRPQCSSCRYPRVLLPGELLSSESIDGIRNYLSQLYDDVVEESADAITGAKLSSMVWYIPSGKYVLYVVDVGAVPGIEHSIGDLCERFGHRVSTSKHSIVALSWVATATLLEVGGKLLAVYEKEQL
jgi:hypothetical protein